MPRVGPNLYAAVFELPGGAAIEYKFLRDAAWTAASRCCRISAIASVSTLRLRTRPRGQAEGFEIRVESGELVDARAAAGSEGTRIEVAELFGTVPARRKFLKSATTEWGHIGDWLARAALVAVGEGRDPASSGLCGAAVHRRTP